jgi:hypothetical protein
MALRLERRGPLPVLPLFRRVETLRSLVWRDAAGDGCDL